ncbi:MAG TPA: S9 family peptidase [Bryobacteraceae bacterium]|nr:S9 family peptidase [Bryobacteraceae bacterium]
MVRILLVLLFPTIVTAAEPALKIPANLRADGIPAIPLSLMDRLDQYGNSRAASLQGWHPTRREMVVLTRFANNNQVHRVAMPLGARTQLTFRRERIVSASYRPRHQDSILYQTDADGAERYQLYLYDLACGCTKLLTDGKSRNDSPVWSRDGRWIAYSSTQRNGADTDIYVLSPDESAGARRVLEAKNGAWEPLDWSPDGNSLLVMDRRSVTDSSLHLLNVSSGSARPITPKGGSWGDALFSTDGKRIYLTTDQDSNFKRLAAIDVTSGKLTVLRAEDKWDAGDIVVSSDGRRLAYLSNEDGSSVLRVLDTRTFEELPLPKLPYGVISDLNWRAGSAELGFSFVTARHPADVFSIDLTTGVLQRWTESETGGIRASGFRDPELVRWKSFDGRMLSGFLYKPPARFSGPRPVIINIHGGPEGQSRPTYLGRSNYLLEELGIALLYPNVRGSTGYGKEFVSLDNGYKREDSVKDIGALLDWIATRPDLERYSVMVTGGSYGGYMTLASMTHYNDRFKCAMDVVGISNWVTFLENTEAYRRDRRRVEYGDERDPKMRDFLSTISPLSRISKITKPMFIVQGRNDPRVPYTESEQVVAALRKQKTPTWYLLADDEGHGFSRKSNQDVQNAAMVLFIQQYLLR